VGAIFGVAKGVVLCVIITLFAVTLLDDSQRQVILDSRSGHYMARLIDRAHAVMPTEVHEVLGPYLHRLSPTLDDPDHALGHDWHGAAGPDLLMLPSGSANPR
jgi:membrane protein required for colicin V production